MTTTTDDQLLLARRGAIEESGWGVTPTIVQPRNFCFWVTLFLLAGGVLQTYIAYQPGLATYPTSVAQGAVYFTLFGAFILWIIFQLDRYSRLPGSVRLGVFLIGGLVSSFAVAAQYNNAFLGILTKTQGSAFVKDWGPGLTAPVSEEIAKQLPLILLIGLAPRVVRSAFDGLIIGMISGLAFQVVESVTYVFHSVDSSFGNESVGTVVLFTRTAFGFTGHWMWSGIVGAGIIYLIGRPAQPRRVGLGLALILAPMVMHGAWDASGALLGALTYVIMGAGTVALLIWTYRTTVPTERQWMRDILAPEVAAGVITEAELDAAVGSRKARRRYVKDQKGHTAERSTRHVLDATHDLADRLALSRGATTPHVEFARAEIARLRP